MTAVMTAVVAAVVAVLTCIAVTSCSTVGSDSFWRRSYSSSSTCRGRSRCSRRRSKFSATW